MINYNRRNFIKSVTTAGVGMSVLGSPFNAKSKGLAQDTIKVGIIGLDTSHSPAFARIINDPDGESDVSGFEVVAAYPHGSRTIESSYSRIPQYVEQFEEMGIEIVDSIDDLISKVDVVLLETNDGHPHLEQALPVLQAGKRMFIDKPVAGSLKDTIAIMEASKEYNTPIFSSSSLRYMEVAQSVRNNNTAGDVLGAYSYGPSSIEESHPDLFWYGIHGVEILFTVMGTGCQSVSRTHTPDTDVIVGTWGNDRLATFRGIRNAPSGFGGTVFGSEEVLDLGSSGGYRPLVVDILNFFRSGVPPVSMEETLEIYAFMEAADESKRRNGARVSLDFVKSKAQA